MPLLVSSASGSVSAFSSGGASSANAAPTGFEALLAALTGGASDAAALKAGIEDLFGKPVELEFEAGALVGVQIAGQAGKLSLAELAQAAGIELPEDSTDPQKLLAELIERLSGLADDPDEQDLAKIDELLDALAAMLDLPLSPAPSETELTRMGANLIKDDASPTERLAGLLADLAGKLGGDNREEAALARSVGAKLGAFAAALGDGATLAELGLDGEGLPPDLEARIAALAAGKPGAKSESPTLSADARLSDALGRGQSAGGGEADDSVMRAATRQAPQPESLARLTADAETPNTAAEIAVQTGTRIETAPVARPVVAGYQTSQQQLNLPQIAFEISRQVQQGNTHFQIRLDPPELGRIDVRMEIDHAGNVTARLAVEKAETLDLMQRDQRTLERALAQAGLDGAKTSLEFSLKQNPFAQQDQGQQGGKTPTVADAPAGEADDAIPAPVVTLYRGTASAGGVNILA
ncbi:hypothetical protein VE25_06705 [Devosia geojensis]|uniref:Flagellar hook-length control protein-like C-terminal domain-containing protein n=1 Tax=Devosia geojensis TaxID=443610 RepID=A0A0F5FWR2_9HYPH|nr:flagellar hook-length control protein FliK [Devosia geojensis]KKB12602.1 hypothetical protein VE25_06705 [Devosia geojensis]